MIRVAVIGGGKGQSALLRGLKHLPNIHLSAIVTVADDGGSTGRLREEFNVPAMGDLRNVMLAMAESESLLSDIMNYRFDSDSRSSLAGHNLGNLILTSLIDIKGDFMEAIVATSKVLNVKGTIIPASTELITLCATMGDGTIIRGESNIPMYRNHISNVYYDVEVEASNEAIRAIEQADLILFGVGSIYTSILPNVIIKDIKEAIQKSSAKKVYFCNAMSQAGETEGYSGEDHVNALRDHTNIEFDAVVESSDKIPEEILERYRQQHSERVVFESLEHTYPIIQMELLDFEDGVIRHDHEKVVKAFEKVMEVVGCPSVLKSKEN